MRFAEVVFEHQLAAEAALSVAVGFWSEGGVDVVQAAGGQQGKVGVMLAVEQQGVLHVGVGTVGVDKHTVGVCAVRQQLSALALLLQVAYAGVHYIASPLVFPAVLQVQLV